MVVHQGLVGEELITVNDEVDEVESNILCCMQIFLMNYYIIIFISSVFSLVYELLLSSTSSYLLGNSVVQFSLTIGVFIGWLGIGSYCAKRSKYHIRDFIFLEYFLAFVWWFSGVVLHHAFWWLQDYHVIYQAMYYFIALSIGVISWAEPIVVSHILSKKEKVSSLLAHILSVDYLWSVLATLIFPFILLPTLGLYYTTLVVGFCNLLLGLYVHYRYAYSPRKIIIMVGVWILRLSGMVISVLTWWSWNQMFYGEWIVYDKTSPYQHIVITKNDNNVKLFLDGNLQFMSLDEHRYHKALRAWWYQYIQNNNEQDIYRVLILWWWDGMLVKTIKQLHPNKKFNITLVDLDPVMTDLSQNNPIMTSVNHYSLSGVDVINDDAYHYVIWQQKLNQKYDIIIADFPDPRDIALAKLYSKELYQMIQSLLSFQWVFTTHAGNVFFMREVFRVTANTITQAFWYPWLVYHTFIPSFGDWWFVTIFADQSNQFLSKSIWGVSISFDFDEDYQSTKTCINSLYDPCILKNYSLWEVRYDQ